MGGTDLTACQRHQKEVSENREWLQEHAMQKGVAMTREDVKLDQATWGARQAETSPRCTSKNYVGYRKPIWD
jgi:hypothetical protein